MGDSSQQQSPVVGAINPAIYSMHNQQSPPSNTFYSSSFDETPAPTIPEDPYNTYTRDADSQYIDYGESDPLQTIGDKLRESFQWAQKSAGHAADSLHHFRQMYITTKENWPKIILPYAGALEIKGPRSGGQVNNFVSTPRDPNYIGVGRVMDHLGMTDRKYGPAPQVGRTRLVSEEEMVLRKAKEILGTPTYRHFLDEIKRHLNIEDKNDLVGRPKLPPNPNLQAKLVIDKLRSTLLLNKAKANLKRLQVPKLPTIPQIPKLLPKPLLKSPLPKLPTIPQISKLLPKPLLNSPLPKLLPPVKPVIPALRSAQPVLPTFKQPTLQSFKPVKISLNDPLKKRTETTKLTSPKNTEKSETVGSSFDRLRAKIKEQNLSRSPVTIKPVISPLEKLRQKLYEKYNITSDTSDILGMTLEKVKNSEMVGATPNNSVKVPTPLLTKEMKTPFMGLATKQDLEKYFKKLYCSACTGNIK